MDKSMGKFSVAVVAFLTSLVSTSMAKDFNYISSFSTSDNIEISGVETAAEIVAASEDGQMLIYSDSPMFAVGMIDISDSSEPKPLGFIQLGGEPTSVSVKNGLAYVGINTSENYVNPTGKLVVIDLETKEVVRETDLGGQPDSVAVAPDGSFVAVAIENERNEDINDEQIPQLPGGFLALVDSEGNLEKVDLTGLSKIAPNDPEPEFVDINKLGETVVTLQENNWITVISKEGVVLNDFSAGTVNLRNVDNTKDGVLSLTDDIFGVRREPDAVKWIDNNHFVTANEGDYKHEAPGQAKRGGSRGWTIWHKDGNVVFESGASFERALALAGYWPEGRAAKKGVEPESVEVGTFHGKKLVFIGAERANAVGVYDISDIENPKLNQILSTGIGPEGLLAIEKRNLFISANEVDTEKSITIYQN